MPSRIHVRWVMAYFCFAIGAATTEALRASPAGRRLRSRSISSEARLDVERVLQKPRQSGKVSGDLLRHLGAPLGANRRRNSSQHGHVWTNPAVKAASLGLDLVAHQACSSLPTHLILHDKYR